MTANSAGYSAHVELILTAGGQRFELGQLGPAHCIVRHPQPVPPGHGDITVTVDGSETHTHIFLPDGISADNRRVRYESAESIVLPASPDATASSPLQTP
jgi:hypothetical protein